MGHGGVRLPPIMQRCTPAGTRPNTRSRQAPQRKSILSEKARHGVVAVTALQATPKVGADVSRDSVAKTFRVGGNDRVVRLRTPLGTKQYRQLVGHWPSGALPHRLVPDKGSYQAFSP
jgi:hypothetical protein